MTADDIPLAPGHMTDERAIEVTADTLRGLGVEHPYPVARAVVAAVERERARIWNASLVRPEAVTSAGLDTATLKHLSIGSSACDEDPWLRMRSSEVRWLARQALTLRAIDGST